MWAPTRRDRTTDSSGSASSDADKPAGAKPAAIIGNALLVGAAAGYAAIAFRFKNMHAAKRGAASAEMRAAEFFSDSAERAQQSMRAEGGRAGTTDVS